MNLCHPKLCWTQWGWAKLFTQLSILTSSKYIWTWSLFNELPPPYSYLFTLIYIIIQAKRNSEKSQESPRYDAAIRSMDRGRDSIFFWIKSFLTHKRTQQTFLLSIYRTILSIFTSSMDSFSICSTILDSLFVNLYIHKRFSLFSTVLDVISGKLLFLFILMPLFGGIITYFN